MFRFTARGKHDHLADTAACDRASAPAPCNGVAASAAAKPRRTIRGRSQPATRAAAATFLAIGQLAAQLRSSGCERPHATDRDRASGRIVLERPAIRGQHAPSPQAREVDPRTQTLGHAAARSAANSHREEKPLRRLASFGTQPRRPKHLRSCANWPLAPRCSRSSLRFLSGGPTPATSSHRAAATPARRLPAEKFEDHKFFGREAGANTPPHPRAARAGAFLDAAMLGPRLQREPWLSRCGSAQKEPRCWQQRCCI